MTLDEAIQLTQDRIKAACATAEVKVSRISETEARLSVYVRAAEVQAVRDATFQPVIDLLTGHGLDLQVFVYDKDAPPQPG